MMLFMAKTRRGLRPNTGHGRRRDRSPLHMDQELLLAPQLRDWYSLMHNEVAQSPWWEAHA